MDCYFCGSLAQVSNIQYDDRYGYPEKYGYHFCKVCRVYFNYFLGNDDKNFFSNLYSSRYGREKVVLNKNLDLIESKGFLKKKLLGLESSPVNWVDQENKILDVGCGSCDSLKLLKNKNKEVYGTDIDKNVSDIGSKLDIPIHIGDINTMPPEFDKFDLILMEQVLEHLPNPKSTLQFLASKLNSNGRIILSTPNSMSVSRRLFKTKWIHWHAPYHICLYSSKAIEILASDLNLKVFEKKCSTNIKWIDYQILHLLNYPTLGVASDFWTGTGKRNSPSIVMKLFLKLRIHYIFSRICDFFGFGDNLIFVLGFKK